jgi:hypothetical protein
MARLCVFYQEDTAVGQIMLIVSWNIRNYL